MKVLTETFRED